VSPRRAQRLYCHCSYGDTLEVEPRRSPFWTAPVAVEAPTGGFVEACPGRMPWRCGVQVGDGCLVSRDALFMPPRVVPNNRLLVDLGRDVGGRRVGVTTDATGLTSVPDPWAAGNRRRPACPGRHGCRRRASAAVIALNADLSGDDVLEDVLALHQALTPRPTGGLNPGATVTTSATDRARTPYYFF
jgi:hypothetical protein